MMSQSEAVFGYAQFEECEALEMPYAGDRLSMVIFLPETTSGWVGFENKMSAPGPLSRTSASAGPRSCRLSASRAGRAGATAS